MAESSAGNSSSSKTLLWMMVAMFAVVGILLGGGFSLTSRMLRAMGMRATSSQDTLHTPQGNLRMERENQVGPGLPVYPRSSMVLPGEAAVAEAARNIRNGVSLVRYHSTDSRDFVDNWYSQHLSSEFKRRNAGENPAPENLRNAGVSGDETAFVAERGAQTRIVAISADATGTMISLIRMDKPAAQ